MKSRIIAAAAVVSLVSAALHAQGQRWVIPPQIVGFGGAPTTALPGAPPASYRVANGVVDSSGNLVFYVVAGSFDIFIVDASGAPIGNISAATLSHQIAIVPLPNGCSRYYVLYFDSAPTTGLAFRAAVVDVAAKQIVSNKTLATYNDNRGVLAVGKLRGDGSRVVYAGAFPSLQKFVLDANGIALDSTLITASGLHPGFLGTQAVLSSDETALAFNDRVNDSVWLVPLDAAGGLGGTPYSYATGPTSGVAFSPDGQRLFYAPDAGAISVIDVTNAHAPIVSLSASSAAYAGSQLQLASDGRIYAASATDLGAIDPAVPSFTPAAIPNVVTGTLSGSAIGGARTLPYQIAGEPQLACDALCGNPSLIQGNFGVKGNFELVVPHRGGGMAHYFRANDNGQAWHGPIVFATDAGTIDAVSMIQSTFGGGKNLEVVARSGDKLLHFWRDAAFQWHGPTAVFGSGASGTPSLIQGNFGTPGNFEVVTPLAGGGMAHYWRDSGTLQWSGPTVFGTGVGVVSDVSLIESSFGGGKNLEVVARVGDTLLHFWRDAGFHWNGPTATFASGIAGAPALIQSRFGTPGNFEVVAPRAAGGLAHYWRNSQTLAWSGPTVFGSGAVRSASLIQSNYGDNFEVAARAGCCLVHYYRDSFPSIAWSNAIPITSCLTTPSATPLIAGCVGECGGAFSASATVTGCAGPQCSVQIAIDGDLCANESVEITIAKNGAPFWSWTYTLDDGDPALGHVSPGTIDVLADGVAPGDVLAVTAKTVPNGNPAACKREGNFRFAVTLLH